MQEQFLIDDNTITASKGSEEQRSNIDEGLSISNTNQSSLAFSFIINKNNNSYSINIDWGEYKEINVEGEKNIKENH